MNEKKIKRLNELLEKQLLRMTTASEEKEITSLLSEWEDQDEDTEKYSYLEDINL